MSISFFSYSKYIGLFEVTFLLVLFSLSWKYILFITSAIAISVLNFACFSFSRNIALENLLK